MNRVVWRRGGVFYSKKQPPHTIPPYFSVIRSFLRVGFWVLIRILCDFLLLFFHTFSFTFFLLFLFYGKIFVFSLFSLFFRKFCRFCKSNIKGPFNFKVRLKGFFRAPECVSKVVWSEVGGGRHAQGQFYCLHPHTQKSGRTYILFH